MFILHLERLLRTKKVYKNIDHSEAINENFKNRIKFVYV
jgi:hypothetical protein